MKVLVATSKPFAPVAVKGIKEVLEAAGHEMVLVEKGTKEDMINAIADCAGLIVRSDIVDKEVMDAAKELKVVVRAGAGYDNIDLAEALQRHKRHWTERQDSRYSRLRSSRSQRGTHRQRLWHEG